MLVKDNFYINFKSNYNKIKIILDLYRVYRHGAGVFNLELINENFINITCLNKNDISLKIDKNKNDISSNSGKIKTNEESISSNSGKIDENKEDILSLKNSNIKSFYNLDKIFIYDIKRGTKMLIKIIIIICLKKK